MPRATAAPKAPTPAQRSAAAVEQVSAYLELDDTKRLGAALTIAAAELLQSDAALSARVRTLYTDLAPAPKPPVKVKKAIVELIPVKSMEGRFYDPLAPLDPYLLLELYGPHQLRLALDDYKVSRLREGVKLVQSRHPNTKPEGISKPALIEYIVTLLLPLYREGSC